MRMNLLYRWLRRTYRDNPVTPELRAAYAFYLQNRNS
jgi:hypothetical protein